MIRAFILSNSTLKLILKKTKMYILLKRTQLLIKRTYLKYHKVRIKCNSKWYGNKYGGFYVCPNLLSSSSIVYSFGIGEDISFDKSIIEEFQCDVFGFDPTPKSIDWVNTQRLPKKFHFFEYGIDNVSGTAKFYLPRNPVFVSGSIFANTNLITNETIDVQMKSFQDIVSDLGHKKIDILKMDIEGSEFHVLESIFKANINIDQILIEFHDRFFKDGKARLKRAEKILQSNGFEIFALSDSLEEVSFIQKNSIQKNDN